MAGAAMNYEAQVRAAPNPKEAMLVIARALDAISQRVAPPAKDPWDGWEDVAPEHLQYLSPPDQRVAINIDDGTADIVLPAVSEERYAARYHFALHQLKLGEFLGDIDGDWYEVYAKGGPMWLYLGNRDLVMSYPESIRRAMVQDVELDSPQDAQEMARDILKHGCETGPTSPMGTDLMGESPTVPRQ